MTSMISHHLAIYKWWIESELKNKKICDGVSAEGFVNVLWGAIFQDICILGFWDFFDLTCYSYVKKV